MNQRKIGVVINYIILALNIVIGLVYTPFMISKLGDGQYGVYSLAGSLVSFVTLLDLGFGQTLVRYISKARATGDKSEEHRLNGLFLKMYLGIAVAALIVGLGIVTLYPQLTTKSMTTEEIKLFRVVFTILLCNVAISFPMSVFSATLNAYEEFFFLKIVNFVMIVMQYMAMSLLLFFGHDLVAITIASFIASLLTQFSYLIYAVKKVGIRFDFAKTEINLTREIFQFSFFIFLNLIIDFLYSNTDKLILGAVAGTVSVSIYAIGVYFSQYFTELSCAMSSVFMPRIMALYQRGEQEEISKLFNRVGRLQMALLFLVLGGYVCLGKEFINLWVGPTYRDSYWIGIIIMLPSIVPLTQNLGITIIRAMNIHKYRSYMYIVIAAVNVLISIPLAMSYGGIGSAIGTGIATVCGQILFMNWFYGKKVHLDIKEYWVNFGKFTVLTLSVAFVISCMKRYVVIASWTALIGMVLVFCAVYMLLYWIALANRDEKRLVYGIIRRK